MRLLACLLIAGLAFVRFESAFAHAFLERASPSAGSALQSAPPIVTIYFPGSDRTSFRRDRSAGWAR